MERRKAVGTRLYYGRSPATISDVEVAILATTTKAAEPGAAKREHVLIDRCDIKNLNSDDLADMDP